MWRLWGLACLGVRGWSRSGPLAGRPLSTFQKAPGEFIDYEAAFDRTERLGASWRSQGDIEDNADRAVRRARGEVRRYNRHNELLEMVTLTFRGDTPPFDNLSDCVKRFWQRWEYATGEKRGAYLWVPEWGSHTGRLHIHMAVSWWARLGCVEVCPKCDRFGVLEKFSRKIRSDFLCVGCLWGLGFVGRPLTREGLIESNDDGRGLSRYLSKYMAKDLGGGVRLGGQRYRVAQGFAPESVTLAAESVVGGVFAALGSMGDRFARDGEIPALFTPSDAESWVGPPVVVLDWKSQPFESE